MRAPASLLLCTAGLLGLLSLAGPVPAIAQAPTGPDTTDGTLDDSTGIVTNVLPLRTITVNSRRGPFTYRLGNDLHIIGPDNRPRRIEQVHPGDEATVYYYIRDGHQTVGRIVLLHQRPRTGK